MLSKEQLTLEYLRYVNIESDEKTFSEKSNFRIMTYNVKGFENYDAIISLINQSNADIICLNEALFFNSELRIRFISDISRIGYQHHKMCNTYGINFILSKYEIQNSKVICLGKDPVKNRNRYAITCQILGLKLCCLHLDPFDRSGNTRFRQGLELIQKLDSEYIILGDFNDTYDSQTLSSFINFGFRDSFEYINKRIPSITHWTCRKIDYILIGSSFKFKISNSMIFKSTVSDHLPIYIDL